MDAQDTPETDCFARIARLACCALGAPVAVISLLEGNRQWLQGPAPLDAWSTHRLTAICAGAIRHGAPLVVADAARDPHFRAGGPALAGAGIRFFACVPLRMHDGRTIGSLCVADPAPRWPSDEQLAALRDLARLAVDELELRRLATIDSLTEAMTRRHFLEQAGHAVALANRYGHTAALIQMDVDHFKRINDRHGHAAGDMVLRQVVAALRAQLRGVDLIGRMGGEEFAVFLPETGMEGATIVAERLRAAIARQGFAFAGGAIAVTASFGVSALGPQEHDVTPMQERADRALYAAKRGGRNRMAAARAVETVMQAVA